MATVTKPIALDESLNTTELSSRNVADVLAQELSAVATAIGGIAVPSADHVSYDNSVSGLSATDVQNALDEIVSDIPTVNNGTLTIQQNGTSKGTFTANSASNVNVNIETPTADKKTATEQFITADGGLLSKCQINLVPVQSGSGDPYPAGGGKNKYNNTATTDTINGVTFTVNADGTVLVNGTATTDAYFYVLANGTSALATYLSDNVNYIVNGCPSGGSSTSYRLQLRANGSYYNDGGNGQPFTYVSGGQDFVRIHIASGYTANNLLFKPMIRLSTETDPTFAPYSNVRPISGHTEVGLDVKDGTQTTVKQHRVQIGSTVYGGYDEIVSGSGKSNYGYIEYDGSVDENVVMVDANKRLFIECPNDSITNSDFTKLCGLTSNRFKEELNQQSYDGIVGFHLRANGTHQIVFQCGYDSGLDTEAKWRTWLSNNPVQVVYPLATPTDITTTPQQIEALVGQNNLSTPLSGQSIETNGVEYKELFTWDDVQSLINNDYASSNTTYSSSFIETKFALKYDLPIISSKVVKASGSTSVTFSHERIFSADQTYCELLQYGSGDRVVVSDVSVTTGSVTFTFASATTQSITFRCRISNVLIG